MKPAQEIITRDGLTELLREVGFKEHVKPSSVISLRRYAADGKTYALCFIFPASSEDPQKNAGFAGMGTVESGKPCSQNFIVTYGKSTYGELYHKIRAEIEPHCGKII